MLQDQKDRKRQLKLRREKAKMLKTSREFLDITETKTPKQFYLQSPPDSETSEDYSLKLRVMIAIKILLVSDAESGGKLGPPNPENRNIEDVLPVNILPV